MIKEQWKIVSNSSLTGEQRVFAGLELVCQPLSFLTVLGIFILWVLRACGVSVPVWFSGTVFPILLAAAIGYLTNWIAIEMLFKPYQRTCRHPFAWLTLGYWRQGLVPKNKMAIAERIGETAEKELLQPETLAKDLCNMVGDMVEEPAVLQGVRGAVQGYVEAHGQEIVDFLKPQIEEAIMQKLSSLCTPDALRGFFDTVIAPRLASEQTREKIATVLMGVIKKNASAFLEECRPMLVAAVENYCYEKAGPFGGIAAKMAGGLVDSILASSVLEEYLTQWLESPDLAPKLKEKMVEVVKALKDSVDSPEADAELSSFVAEIQATVRAGVQKWLDENLNRNIRQIATSERLWGWLKEQLPAFRKEIEELVATQGMPRIQGKLDISGRIQAAVAEQSMERFHAMINDVAAQHLGAIQVLGYILGGIAGALCQLAIAH